MLAALIISVILVLPTAVFLGEFGLMLVPLGIALPLVVGYTRRGRWLKNKTADRYVKAGAWVLLLIPVAATLVAALTLSSTATGRGVGLDLTADGVIDNVARIFLPAPTIAGSTVALIAIVKSGPIWEGRLAQIYTGLAALLWLGGWLANMATTGLLFTLIVLYLAPIALWGGIRIYRAEAVGLTQPPPAPTRDAWDALRREEP
jgi:hypothetical protein